MKKVGIASCYFKGNYGSVLQAFATQEILTQMEIPNETIDISGLSHTLRSNRAKYYIKHLFDISLYRSKGGFILNRLVEKCNYAGMKKNQALRRKAFEGFRKERFQLSRQCNSFSELSEHCKAYSHVLVGSDQLWLPVNIDMDYYTLHFVPDTVKKVSYATSFGLSSLSSHYLKKTAAFLSGFSHISVREYSAQDIVSQASGKKAELVCDPVLLFSGEEWTRMLPGNHKNIAPPYIFCYYLGNNPAQRDFALRLKAHTGLPIIFLPHADAYISSDESFGDKQLYDISPENFVELLRNAQYVCTDSFHGTVFSLLYHRQFFSFPRFAKEGAQSTNTRLQSLFALLGVNQQGMNPALDIKSALQHKQDYTAIDTRISLLRETSLEYLQKAFAE